MTFGDVRKFRDKSSGQEENAWVLGWVPNVLIWLPLEIVINKLGPLLSLDLQDHSVFIEGLLKPVVENQFFSLNENFFF